MITIDELRTVCPKCKGAGFIQDWQWAQWWAENNLVPPENHPLHSIHEELPCEHCDEIGYVPTEQGRVLLEFMSTFRGRR